MISFKGAHFPQDILLTCGRWYVVYPLSSRQVEELMEERGVAVDYATINCYDDPEKFHPLALSALCRLSGARDARTPQEERRCP